MRESDLFDEQPGERELVIVLLQQMSTGMERLNSQMGEVKATTADINLRLAIIEANPITALVQRLEALEDAEQRRKGAYNLVAWMKDYTPWLLAIAVGLYAVAIKPK